MDAQTITENVVAELNIHSQSVTPQVNLLVVKGRQHGWKQWDQVVTPLTTDMMWYEARSLACIVFSPKMRDLNLTKSLCKF